jgi:hypothetical protein
MKKVGTNGNKPLTFIDEVRVWYFASEVNKVMIRISDLVVFLLVFLELNTTINIKMLLWNFFHL